VIRLPLGGIDTNIEQAGLLALVSAFNRAWLAK